MGKKSDHRKAEAKLRAEAEAALKLEFDGRHEEAIARVDDLAARHEESAPVLHLAANVHDAAANRAYRAGDDDASARHYRTARGYLIKARELVPNCISISNFLAKVLFRSGEVDEAEKVAREAVGIADPVDPAKNNVAYASRAANTTRDQRVLNCRNLARQTLGEIGRSGLPARVSEVLKLDTGAHDGSREALTKAKELAKSYPSSSRAQLLFAHMQLQRVRLLHPDMDRRGFLDRIRADVKQAIASTFGNSLVFAMFHAKLCFVLGLYADAHFECVRAFDMPEPVDPRLEDVPPRSVQGDTLELRLRSVDEELGRLVNKLFSVADAFRCSMARDRQAGFLSLGLLQLQDYYHQNFGSYQWAVAQTISDALTFVSQNRSWRFWICPFCAGNKLPNTDSLLEHINSKHLRKLRSLFGSVLPQYFIEDDVLDDITIYQDSEGHHFFRFNNKDYVFACLSVPTQELSIAGVQDKICQRGKEILQDIEVKLKSLPADELSAEFDTACSEIQHLWDAFLRNSFLDYRILIKKLARPFIWTKLLQSLSEDKAASKISNADIDVIFPNVVDVREVHAEDNVGRLEIHPNSSIADVQSGAAGLKYVPSNANENSASNLLGIHL
ncbi:uncharacterized protein [Lolium perenne]|uniref:uncharacterized protein n=1 Tax=Lolium perenne TaxID=4522 RepID=UPI0021F54332|nr:uncharacterized protein LOC127295246 [Lolium perenne]XP_051181121.1 uncharacterized protein LOC127295246 [Lolium perenne]XP_051181122.1 uncharacterized protein LOC127295246 [Lolium perenne]